MTGRYASKWIKLAVLAVSAVAALALAGGGVLAAARCKKVDGTFTLQAVSESCASAIQLCAVGTYSGDLRGSSFFVGSSLIPTVDTPATGVVLVTGDNAIRTFGGTLNTKDAIVLRTSGAGDFAEVDTISGGTGRWAGATGSISAHGTFVNGAGAGEYAGEICTP